MMFYSLRRFITNVRILRGTTPDILSAGNGATRRAGVELAMQLIVSLAVLIAGLFVLLSKQPEYGETTQKIAAGWVGAVVGYWMR